MKKKYKYEHRPGTENLMEENKYTSSEHVPKESFPDFGHSIGYLN